MGGLSVGTAEELGRQRRAELERLGAARSPGARRRSERRVRRLRRGAGRALVAAGVRLAGAEGAGRPSPASI